MECLKKEFPRLPICLCGDSLYACEAFFEQCRRNGWKYLLNFREGSIPSIVTEYEALRQIEDNRWSVVEDGVEKWYNFAENIEYRGHSIQFIEYGSSRKDNFSYLLTNLPLHKRNVPQTVQAGRKRWKIENEGVQSSEESWVLSGARFLLPELGYEEPLSPYPNRTYDFTGHGDVGFALEKGRTNLGVEASANFGVLEDRPFGTPSP